MKLNFGKRLVLFFNWLLSLLGCALAFIFCVWPDRVYAGFDWAYGLIGKRNTDIIGIALAAIYAILAIVSVCILFSNAAKRAERGFITVDSSDSGKTRIAVGAVEQMIRQAVRGVEGIAEMKTSIANVDDAISISANVSILSGVHVPTVTMNIQRSIRSYIELNCGVAVRDVSVSVHSVMQPDEGGKRGRRRNASQAAAPVAPVSYSEPVSPVAEPAEAVPVAAVAEEAAPAEEASFNFPAENDAEAVDSGETEEAPAISEEDH